MTRDPVREILDAAVIVWWRRTIPDAGGDAPGGGGWLDMMKSERVVYTC